METASAPDPAMPPLRQRLAGLPRPVWVICTGMFLNKLGNFLNVFLVLYLTHRGYSAFLAGVALGAVGIGSFLGNGVGGTVADHVGRRATIVVSMFGSAVLILLVPVCSDIRLMISLAVAIGFFSQLYRPAGGAILVDVARPDQRVMAFGLLRLAINLGMSFGPMIGGFLSGVSYFYPFVGNAVASAAFGVVVLVMLPETGSGRTQAAGARSPGGYRRVFADRSMRLYLIAIFAANYVYTQTNVTLPLRIKDVHLSNSFYGILLGANAIGCVLTELPLTRFTGRHHPGPDHRAAARRLPVRRQPPGALERVRPHRARGGRDHPALR